jgi:hypothetical protein
METQIMAYCGINCSGCDAYKATQAQDEAELARVAAIWAKEYDPTLTAETIRCDGCLATDGPLCSYCSECPVRACAIDRGVQSCAYCNDYACETLEGFLSHASGLREVLDKMRADWLVGNG